MLITEYSFLMAVFWSSVVLVILAFALKKKLFIKYFGVSSLIFIYVMCVIRLVIPIELPFVHIIELPGVVSRINDVIFLEDYMFAGILFKAVDLLSLIWVIGIGITAAREGVLYRKALKKWEWIHKSENEQCERALANAKVKFNKIINVNIWISKQVQIPMGIGVIRKQIIIPDSIKTEKQLFGVVLHEYAHFLNHDIIIKVLYEIFCCTFWWNPCVYLLKKNLDQVLEIKCDLAVIDLMNKKECVEYLETILYLIQENKREVKENHNIPYVQLFHVKTKKKIMERFQVMLDNQMRRNKRNRAPTFICLILFSVLLLGTYAFQIQPSYEPGQSELPVDQEMTPQNTYIIDNGDGTYTLVDKLKRIEDRTFHMSWLIDDMISQGFRVVEKDRRK